MAVTKIWNVKSHLQELIDYVGNVEKTTKNFSEDTIAALIEYGVDVLKTEERLYVTPINCQPHLWQSSDKRDRQSFPICFLKTY